MNVWRRTGTVTRQTAAQDAAAAWPELARGPSIAIPDLRSSRRCNSGSGYACRAQLHSPRGACRPARLPPHRRDAPHRQTRGRHPRSRPFAAGAGRSSGGGRGIAPPHPQLPAPRAGGDRRRLAVLGGGGLHAGAPAHHRHSGGYLGGRQQMRGPCCWTRCWCRCPDGRPRRSRAGVIWPPTTRRPIWDRWPKRAEPMRCRRNCGGNCRRWACCSRSAPISEQWLQGADKAFINLSAI